MRKIEKTLVVEQGVELKMSIFLPGEGHFPVLLAMTPYSRQQLFGVAEFLAGNGYAVVLQDVRGRYDSGGHFAPVQQERKDGPITVDWIYSQPWCDSSRGIGIIGISYLSLTGLLAAKNGGVKAMLNAGGLADSYGLTHRGGAVVFHHALPWSIIVGHSRTQPDLKGVNWDRVFRIENLEQADQVAGFPSQVWQEIAARPARDDFWEELSIWNDLEKVDMPILHYTGWYDICLGPTLELFSYFQDKSRFPQSLIIGPWSHGGTLRSPPGLAGVNFGEQSRSDIFSRSRQWFDHYLQEKENLEALSGGRIKLFITGSNQWLSCDHWPPARGRETTLYLGSGGLSWAKEERSDAVGFDFDPADPVPTLGGGVWEFPDADLNPGPVDQSPISRRSDVVLFQTRPLKSDLTLAGPLQATIYGSVQGESGDWVLRLVDVDQEGKRRWVADGIIRGHFREGSSRIIPLRPDKIESFEIDLWAVGHTWKKGHCLGLEISGSSFPKWDLNRTGLARGEVRKQKIYWGGNYPSCLRGMALE